MSTLELCEMAFDVQKRLLQDLERLYIAVDEDCRTLLQDLSLREESRRVRRVAEMLHHLVQWLRQRDSEIHRLDRDLR